MKLINSPVKRSILLILIVFFSCAQVFAYDLVERRKDQFGKDFAYYLYPIAGEVPGLGTAAGFGGTVLNLGGTDADITGYIVRGDFHATGLALIDYQFIPKRLILDVGYNDYLVAPVQYQRGLDSNANDFIQPKAEGRYLISQLTLSFLERRFEAFIRGFAGRERLHEILDADGNAFENIDQSWKDFYSLFIGGSIDLTDDRLDPRVGNRLELSIKLPKSEPAADTEYMSIDFNATHYMPMRRWDTLVFNFFASRSFVTREGETDFAILQLSEGLNCTQNYPAGSDRDACIKAETQRLNQIIAHRKYGTTSSLGGTQRLRGYDNYRFYASKVLFYGVEYRWNLTDEHTPFNIYIAKGVRTGIQLAAFVERGSVSDGYRDLVEKGKNSYGLGFRVVLSGVVIRIDAATGDEGFQTQLFITYPWSMFSVDSPG